MQLTQNYQVIKCIVNPGEGTAEAPGRMKAIYNQLASEGFFSATSGTPSTSSFTATVRGYEGEITVSCSNSQGIRIYAGGKQTGSMGLSGLTDVNLYYATDYNFFAIHGGVNDTQGVFVYFGKTTTGRWVMWASSTGQASNGVIFLDRPSAVNGRLITAQLPLRIGTKWAERPLRIVDGDDNLVISEDGEGGTVTAGFRDISNVAMPGVNGFLRLPSEDVFRGAYVHTSTGPFDRLHTPIKISYNSTIDLTVPEESEA